MLFTEQNDAAPGPSTSPGPSLAPLAAPRHRPLIRRVLHWIRRGHLYLGLFLLPWAILYGVTGFLFNHPDAFPDQPALRFDRSALVGTRLESLPDPRGQSALVVAALNDAQKPTTPYRLGDAECRYGTRDFVFATLRADVRTYTILYDVRSGSGSIRESIVTGPGPKAPFAVGKPAATRMRMNQGGEALKIEGTLVDRFRASLPTVCERLGLPSGEVTVTSAPDLIFPIEVDTTWSATCNLATNAVSGSTTEASDMTFRRFLLRMHLTHTYPGETNAKWVWAIFVDVMAAVMCFWGLSGLLMWWQIKSTRWPGAIVLLVSVASAAALGIAMHAHLSA